MVLEQPRLVEPAQPDRVVAGVANQRLGELARLLVGRIEVARPCALARHLGVERRVVRAERLRNGPARDRLDLVRERLEPFVPTAEGIRRIDRRLAFDPGHAAQRLADRARRHRHEHDVCVRRVTAVAADLRDLVTCVAPKPGQSAADVAAPDRDDLHPILLR